MYSDWPGTSIEKVSDIMATNLDPWPLVKQAALEESAALKHCKTQRQCEYILACRGHWISDRRETNARCYRTKAEKDWYKK
jgi:hypothetical protein